MRLLRLISHRLNLRGPLTRWFCWLKSLVEELVTWRYLAIVKIHNTVSSSTVYLSVSVCMYVCMYVCKFVMHLINSCSLQMATLATYFGLGRQTHRYYLFANMQAILSYVEFLFADICCYGYSGAWMMFGWILKSSNTVQQFYSWWFLIRWLHFAFFFFFVSVKGIFFSNHKWEERTKLLFVNSG